MRRIIRLAYRVLCALIALPGGISQLEAADLTSPTLFKRAEFVLSVRSTVPEDSADWQPVALPDDWRRLGSDFQGQGWYRIPFHLTEVPQRPLAIYLRHPRSREVEFFVNGTLLAGSRDLHPERMQATGFPILLTIPPTLLRQGENMLQARMRARTVQNPPPGLGHLVLGDTRELRRMFGRDLNLTAGAVQMFSAAMLTAGVIAIFLWFARRGDMVMLWFGITCLSWAAVRFADTHLRWIGFPESLMQIGHQYANWGLPVPAVILCLRTVGLRRPGWEAVLWAHLAFLVTFGQWLPPAGIGWAWDYLRVSGPLVCLAGALVVFVAAPRPMRWSHWVEGLAMVAMGAAFSFDFARELGWIPLDSHNLRAYHVPVLLLAFGAAIFERHVAAVWRTERSNLELERRVAEKAREIEANHARVEQAARAEALARERSRILADMHDGVGASLVGLLRHVQSGGADRASIEQRVQEALQEMRIAIDAMQPRGGDLGTVLGSLRYRLDDTIRSTGVGLVWEVEELPAVEELKPSTVFSLQRILLEAITNALKHSGARRLRFVARARSGSRIEIRVEDDGCGFDPAQPVPGLGLANMRSRAEKIGASIDIDSAPGRGTVVGLVLPGASPRRTAEDAPAKSEPQNLAKLADAPGAA